MKQRSVASVIILTILTFGIYYLFWLRNTKNEMRLYGQKNVPSMWWLVGPALVLLLGYLAIIPIVGFSESTTANPSTQLGGASMALFALMIPVWAFATFYPLYWHYRYCQAIEVVTKRKVELSTSYVIYVLAWLIGIPIFFFIYVVQKAFNEMALSGTGPSLPKAAAENAPVSKTGQDGPLYTRK